MSTVDNYRWDDRSLYFNVTWFELRNISTVNRTDLNYVALHRDEVLHKLGTGESAFCELSRGCSLLLIHDRLQR